MYVERGRKMDAPNVLILGASRYEFEDEKTGRAVKGTTVHYVALSPVNEENKVGLSPAKATLSYSYFEQFEGVTFPCVAEPTITLDFSNKKNQIKFTGFKLLDSVMI